MMIRYPWTSSLEYTLVERCICTQGDQPEIYQVQTQNQANQNDWPKEAWKKCPEELTEITMRVHEGVTLTLSELERYDAL